MQLNCFRILHGLGDPTVEGCKSSLLSIGLFLLVPQVFGNDLAKVMLDTGYYIGAINVVLLGRVGKILSTFPAICMTLLSLFFTVFTFFWCNIFYISKAQLIYLI